jgi:hypothetical protein
MDNQNVRIRKVTTGGTISTIAGDGSNCSSTGLTNSFGADNPGICGSYNQGLIGGAGGTLYFRNAGWFDELSLPGGMYHVASTLSRPCSQDADGDAFATCMFPDKGTIGSGGLYYGSGATVKKWNLSPTGTISTVAGNGNPSCNTPANNGAAAVGACIHPNYLVASGNSIYFFDVTGTRGPIIFRIDLSESPMLLHQVAGNGSWCDSSGVAVNSCIGSTGPLALVSSGDIYLASTGHGVIRKVSTAGYLSDVVNVGGPVRAMASDRTDNLYTALPNSNKVMKVSGLVSSSSAGNLTALGDSVAAAEGIKYGYIWDGSKWLPAGSSGVNPDWADTTASMGTDYEACHQSEYAYSRLFYNQYQVSNMACTGASAMGGVLNSYTRTDPDGDPTSTVMELGGVCTGCGTPSTVFDGHNPDVVTLTVGANDVDFGGWLGACYNPLTNPCDTTANSTTLSGQLATEKDNLRLILTELNRWAGTKSKTLRVLVTGYYDPFPSSVSSGCIDTGAGVLQGTYPNVGLTGGELSFLKNGLIDLNGNISSEVTYAQDPNHDPNLNVSFVSLTNAMSGHEFCTTDPWMYGISIRYPPIGGGPGNNPAPFHPTPAGQLAIYQAVKAAL